MLELSVGQATDPGKLRAVNEDATGMYTPRSEQEGRSHGWMFVVADGVGGLDFGDVAARQTVSLLEKGFARSAPGTSLSSTLTRLIQEANAAVHDAGLHPERRGKRLASTVVACALRYDQAVVAHVGDSRCYHLRGSKIVSVTADHSFVDEQLRMGLITAAEAADSENRNVLTRCLGPERYVRADTLTLQLKAGDRLLLCTDGLHGTMYERDIARMVFEAPDPQQAAEQMVRYATEIDGTDNATAIVAEVRAVESAAFYRRRPFRIPGI